MKGLTITHDTVEEKQKLYLNTILFYPTLLFVEVEEKQKLYLNMPATSGNKAHYIVEEKQKLYLNAVLTVAIPTGILRWRETKVVFKYVYCIS